MFAGATLCAAYSRSRWGDKQHACEVYVDEHDGQPCYIELKIKEFKTKKAGAWLGAAMLAVAPAIGIVENDWVTPWMKVRDELKIDPRQHPTMPAPSPDGLPTVRPLNTAEFGRWIQLILGMKCSDGSERRTTSHSCKATILSQMAKFGASITDREIFGGHTSHIRKS